MPHSYIEILFHIVFATKERAPMITPLLQASLYRYMAAVVRDRHCRLLAVNGIADHVHMLVRGSTRISIADLVRDVKANSSRWVKQNFQTAREFTWQEGYGAFSVSPCDISDLEQYIANQEEHHRVHTFEEEYLALLAEHDVEYDPRYLWA